MAEKEMAGGNGGDEEKLKLIKKHRKIEKGKMTRTINLLKSQCSTEEKDANIIADLLQKAKVIMGRMEEVHERYGLLETDDESFEEAEKEMEDRGILDRV